jgi:Glycosyl transferases group 1
LNPRLHIVCLDVPYPADYGGAIDMLYKIQALHGQGVKIHLHYFSYNLRGTPNELNQYCETIHVYERKTGYKGFSFSLPYIVSSRINSELIKNLQQDNYPVLLEGLHCTGILKEINKNRRKIIVRLHNDECSYYKQLVKTESNLFKKIYFLNESRLLKKYEKQLPQNVHYAFTSETDTNLFKNQYNLPNVSHLPVFSLFNRVKSKTGLGNFCLYHGDLSDPCNKKAAIWLLSKVFNDINTPLVIAGKEPGKQIIKLAEFYSHTCLIANPSKDEMEDLISKAHINVLPSFSNKRPEQKLTHALLTGRHCIVNDNAVTETGIESACHIGKNAAAFKSIILQLYRRPFEEEEINLRKKIFLNLQKEEPVKKLLEWLYE